MLGRKDIYKVLSDREFEAFSGNCIGNAAQAALVWHIETTKSSRIHNVVVPKLGPHAYLEINRKVYSRGVTWPNSDFPEVPYSALLGMDNHEDITTLVAFNMLTSVTNNEYYIGLLGYKPDLELGIDLDLIPFDHVGQWQDAIAAFAIMTAVQDDLLEVAQKTRDIYARNK